MMFGGASTTRPALHKATVLMQLCSFSARAGRKVDVHETVNKNSNFCTPINAAPMPRVMPVIP